MPYNYLTDKGIIIPDTSTIKAEVEAEFREAFGSDVSLQESSLLGRMIAVEVAARSACVRQNAAVANQINPDYSGGKFLDAIGALTHSRRVLPTRTQVKATLTGIAGTIVNAGRRVRTMAGDIFTLSGTVIIGSDGTIEGDFVAQQIGPIPATANTLTNIIDEVFGWESVNNGTDGLLGRNTQGDYNYRMFRRGTLAKQGTAIIEAIQAQVLSASNVRSAFIRENWTGVPRVEKGVTLAAHSFYACVDGGTDMDVAVALRVKKSGGANWNGDVEVTTREPYSGQTYEVKFERPTPVPLKVRLDIRSQNTIVDAVTVVKGAIMDYANGDMDGERGFAVGEDVSSWELAGAVNQSVPRLYVVKCEISIDGGVTWSPSNVTINGNQKASVTPDDIFVTVVT